MSLLQLPGLFGSISAIFIWILLFFGKIDGEYIMDVKLHLPERALNAFICSMFGFLIIAALTDYFLVPYLFSYYYS